MSKVEMTVQQISDLGLWEKVCEYKGWNKWILNEGRIDANEFVEFDSEFKKQELEMERFKMGFEDSYGNDIELFSGITDRYLHISMTNNNELSNGYLSYEDVDRLISMLKTYKEVRMQ